MRKGIQSHEEWKIKFDKSREGKLMNLKNEHQDILGESRYKASLSIDGFCASALWIVIKGTKLEEDGKYFIELLQPDFFKD